MAGPKDGIVSKKSSKVSKSKNKSSVAVSIRNKLAEISSTIKENVEKIKLQYYPILKGKPMKKFSDFLDTDDEVKYFEKSMEKIFKLFNVPKESQRTVFLYLRTKIPIMNSIYNKIMLTKGYWSRYIRGDSKDVKRIILSAFVSNYFTGVPVEFLISMSMEESGMKCNTFNHKGSYGPFQINTGGSVVEVDPKFGNINPWVYKTRTKAIKENIYFNTGHKWDIKFGALFSLPIVRLSKNRYIVKKFYRSKKGNLQYSMKKFYNPYYSAITSAFATYANYSIGYRRHHRYNAKNKKKGSTPYLDFSKRDKLKKSLIYYTAGGRANPKNKSEWSRANTYAKKIQKFMVAIFAKHPNKNNIEIASVSKE